MRYTEATTLKNKAKAITKKLVPQRKQKQVVQRIEEDIPKIRDWMEQERAMEMGQRARLSFQQHKMV